MYDSCSKATGKTGRSNHCSLSHGIETLLAKMEDDNTLQMVGEAWHILRCALLLVGLPLFRMHDIPKGGFLAGHTHMLDLGGASLHSFARRSCLFRFEAPFAKQKPATKCNPPKVGVSTDADELMDKQDTDTQRQYNRHK